MNDQIGMDNSIASPKGLDSEDKDLDEDDE